MSYLLFGASNRMSHGAVHSAQMRPKTPKSVVSFHHLLRPGLSCSKVGTFYRYPPCKSDYPAAVDAPRQRNYLRCPVAGDLFSG